MDDGAMHEPGLRFQPRWKEELVCTCEQGSFVLGMPMGVPSVDFPTEETWQREAPAWARPYWASIRNQLAGWCESQGLPLHVGPFGHVYCMP
ncbi:MAG: hypothetical protein AB1593_02790 [Pseudomonadota bacterium]